MKLFTKIFLFCNVLIFYMDLIANDEKPYWGKKQEEIRRVKVNNFLDLIRDDLNPENIDMFIRLHVTESKGNLLIDQKLKTRIIITKIKNRIKKQTLKSLEELAAETNNKIKISSLIRLLGAYQKNNPILTKEELYLRRFATKLDSFIAIDVFISILEKESSNILLQTSVKRALNQFRMNKEKGTTPKDAP